VVRVGICGFAERQRKLFRDFDLLEVQKTFYQPPRVTTARRWRERAGEDFIFTLKAWQLITHESYSPTYGKLTEELSREQQYQAGSFKWNPVTRMAFDRTQEIAGALEAAAILFQTPKSFSPTEENLDRLRRFFHEIHRGGRRMIFEPRGAGWKGGIMCDLVETLHLIHAVDPFLRPPVGRGLRYYRLHGRPAYNYRHKYTREDLAQLESMLDPTAPNWVLFNNMSMAEDARRFLRRIR
jgi:uncharacterized protein YecE (DUF72 family)